MKVAVILTWWVAVMSMMMRWKRMNQNERDKGPTMLTTNENDTVDVLVLMAQ